MNQDLRLKRHADLWEAQNALIKRVVLASLAFGVLVAFKVLTPYANIADRRKEALDALKGARAEEVKVDNASNVLGEFQRTADAVSGKIAAQPWMSAKDALVRRLAAINSTGQGSSERYQREADDTIRAIAGQVRDEVLMPLGTALARVGASRELLPDLSAQVDGLPAVLDHWEKGNLAKRWYESLDHKTMTVTGLTANMQVKLSSIDAAIRLEAPRLEERKRELLQRKGALQQQASEIQAQLEALKQEMEKILPEWGRGLLSVPQMVQLFPLIIMALVAYALALAWTLTEHFRYVARHAGYAEDDLADPVLSSLWTLTQRGRFGTAATLATYLAFILAMWAVFEHGARVLAATVRDGADGLLTVTVVAAGCWIGRGLFLAATWLLVGRLLGRRSRVHASETG